MCMLNELERVKVRNATFIKMAEPFARPFTGQDVAMATTDLERMPAREVSAYVRELFNKGEMPGWASTQVVPGTGPVLYFKVAPSSKAGRAVRRIKKALNARD